MDRKILGEEIRQELNSLQTALATVSAKLEEYSRLVEEELEAAQTPVPLSSVEEEEYVSNPKAEEVEEKPRSRDLRLIQDLRTAIGLNDRFRFRHELFQDNDDWMRTTLDDLNALESLEQVQDYIQSHFSWDETNPTVAYFFDLLGRKHYRS